MESSANTSTNAEAGTKANAKPGTNTNAEPGTSTNAGTKPSAGTSTRLRLLVFAFPLVLAGIFMFTYPFSDCLEKTTLSLDGLSRAQRSNVLLAAHAVNGIILRPGEEFSFNKVVGPRTSGRGYRPAPSYVGSENQPTMGGGICLMSSAVYQLALQSGFQISQRVAHLRTIKSVAPGLDATVWYGRADLKFKNTYDVPVQLNTSWSGQTLSVSLMGRQSKNPPHIELRRLVNHPTPDCLVVELLRKSGADEQLISRDLYTISQ